MDLDNEELIATKYSDIKEAIEIFERKEEYFDYSGKGEKAINIALKFMKNYIDGGDHIPRID